MSKLDGKIEIGGHTLTFNVNALCDLEEAFGVEDINAVLAKIASLQERPSLRTIRTIFAVAMRQENPDLSETDAGLLISEIGIDKAAEALGQAMAQAFPDSDEDVGNAKRKPVGAGKKS